MKPTFTQFVRTAARERLKRLDRCLELAAGRPEDPEIIHDLRVAIRRFTQCLRTFEDLLDPDFAGKLRRRLKKVLDRSADVRNYDIAIELLDAGPFARLITSLRLERSEAEAGLTRRLRRLQERGPRGQWLLRLRMFHKPSVAQSRWVVDNTVGENASRVLPMLASELFAAGQKATATGADLHELHKLRLLGKRFRYTLEIFATAYGRGMQQRIETLKILQDHLGAVNDCVTSLELLHQRPRACSAIRKILKRREAQCRALWRKQFPALVCREWEDWLSQPRREHNGHLHSASRRSGSPAARARGKGPEARLQGQSGG